MKRLIKTIISMAIIGIISSGCASLGVMGNRANTSVSQPVSKPVFHGNDLVNIDDSREKLRDLVEQFNDEISNNNCTEASRIRREILDKYESENKQLEEELLSSECLCYLDDGEKGFFVQCVEELRGVCSKERFLDKDTQFVLSLGKEFGVSIDECEDKISENIETSMQSIFEGEEK